MINSILVLFIVLNSLMLGDIDKDLIDAVRDLDFEKVKTLVQQGANVNAKDSSGRSVFYYAIEGKLMDGYMKRDENIIVYLLEQKIDIEESFPGSNSRTALMVSIYYGDLKVARLLIEKGANVNHKDGYGVTALMLACHNGYTEIAKMLIHRGADVNALTSYNHSALLWAAKNGQLECVRLLLSYKASMKPLLKNDTTYLIVYSICGDYENLSKIIGKEKKNINKSDKDGKTPLMHAAERGKNKVAVLLLEYEADVNAKDKEGVTALMLAAGAGQTDTVELLLKHGADVTIRSTSDKTAIDYASIVTEGYEGERKKPPPEIREMLLKAQSNKAAELESAK